ncbi:MAG: hypothetical protein U5P41_13290 [Gammaproteobacteria bacterium]|nr:hypothetical protein [Gammaproteobacteria bacterium]
MLWKSGRNQYVKYAELDTGKFGENDHPVQLDPAQIATALEALQFRSEESLCHRRRSEARYFRWLKPGAAAGRSICPLV